MIGKRSAQRHNRILCGGTRIDIFVSLSEFNQVKTIFLDWQGISEIGVKWISLNDTSNLLIQSYHALTGSDQLCTWIETPGKTGRRYDKAFQSNVQQSIPGSHSAYFSQPNDIHPVWRFTGGTNGWNTPIHHILACHHPRIGYHLRRSIQR